MLVDNFLNWQAAVEEGIVVGGGCTLLRLASKVDAIIETLENDEQRVSPKVQLLLMLLSVKVQFCITITSMINLLFFLSFFLFFIFKVGAEIVRKSLSYPLKLIAKNAGVNGSVVIEKVCIQNFVMYGLAVVQ